MAIIRRVTIHQLRNVKPGCTFELHRGLNLLLGRNGTGKTTLLQWMADFLSGNLKAWEDEPYHVKIEIDVETETQPASVHVEVKNHASRFPLRDILAHGSGEQKWGEQLRGNAVPSAISSIEVGQDRYQIRAKPPFLSLDANGRALYKDIQIEVPFAEILARNVHFMLQMAAEPENVFDRAIVTTSPVVLDHVRDKIISIAAHIGSYTQITRFDESLSFSDRLLVGANSQWRLSIASNGATTIYTQSKTRFRDSIIAHLPTDAPALTLSDRIIGGFLRKAVDLFDYRGATASISLLEKANLPKNVSYYEYGNLRFSFHLRDGSIIPHDALSYGQKRMLAFLYYLELNPRFIVVDELVNGLHHAWIEACIEEIGDRQGLMTSQNPLLLDHMSFDSVEDVRTSFILCRSERKGDSEQLIWRNPTEEEAQSFFDAYQVGIQHVSEILVDEGLW